MNAEFEPRFGIDSMAQTAENLAESHSISSLKQDAFASRSQQRYARARANFECQILPLTVQVGKEVKEIRTDEHPRPEATLEMLARLKGVVTRRVGVTVGNSSGINDGASAVLLASERANLH